MFRFVYLAIGVFLITLFVGWSAMGKEMDSGKKVRRTGFAVAAARVATGRSSRGYRSRSTWFGSGGGWGK